MNKRERPNETAKARKLGISRATLNRFRRGLPTKLTYAQKRTLRAMDKGETTCPTCGAPMKRRHAGPHKYDANRHRICCRRK